MKSGNVWNGEGKTDYHSYHLTWMEIGSSVVISMMITGVVAYLFYDSMFGILLFPAMFVLVIQVCRDMGMQRQYRELEEGFLQLIDSMSVGLHAGLSLENAVGQARQELEVLYAGKNHQILKELSYIQRGLEMNQTIDMQLQELGQRSNNHMIFTCALIMQVAKRNGGSLVAIMEQTTATLQLNHEVEQEIRTVMIGKQVEQWIMGVMPMGMLLYLRLGNGEYLNALYHNAGGILFMSICLVVTVVANLWGMHIAKIRV